MNKHLLATFAVAALLVLAPQRSIANPFDEAREAFAEAESLYAGGEYAQAADKYHEAYTILRSPVLFFNIAQARRLEFQTRGDYENLLEARRYYERFLEEAEPTPDQRSRAEANLEEVEQGALQEARRQFAEAEQAVRVGEFEEAIAGYSAAYELWPRPAFLFNLAQAQRKQFKVDGDLSRLARAEDLILTYGREGGGEVADSTLEQILAEIRGERAEYHRRREAEARSAEPEAMAEARNLYRGGDGAEALAALEKAESIEGLERVVLVELHRLKGQAAALAGQNRLAIDAFRRYLAMEPAADGVGLSDASQPFFEAAMEYWEGKQPLTIEHLPPGRVPPNRPVSIPVRIASDPLEMIRSRKLFYRREGSSEWEVVEMAPSEQTAELPRTPLPLTGKEYRMEYYVAATDENGAVLDSLGSSNAPLAFLVTEDAINRPPPIYKRWWPWASAGVVVAGTIATIAIVRDDGLPDPPVIGDLSQGLRR